MRIYPWLAALLVLLHARTTPAASPQPELPRTAPAVRFSNLSAAACRAEARRLGTSVARVRSPASGVAAPVRLAGPLGGVKFQTASGKSPYGILDCRLLLALESFAQLLSKFDVTSVRIDNMYRPRARLPGKRRKSQHAYGLAADITEFTLSDGRVVNVEKDWEGSIGEPVCLTPKAKTQSPNAKLLRDIACGAFNAGIFHHMLTPNFNRAHRNHFHFDIQRGTRRATIE